MQWVAVPRMMVQIRLWPYSSVAQLAEQMAVNHLVVGSNPTWGVSSFIKPRVGSSVGRAMDF